MTSVPDNLVPLPTQPWEQRPVELPLDVEECRTALWRTGGNIARAADLLKIPSARLRSFVKKSPYLSREIEEASEVLVDMAEDVVADALRDPDRADGMAKFVLSTKGKHRGWGTANSGSVNVDARGGNITVVWGDGSVVAASKEVGVDVIDGEVVDG